MRGATGYADSEIYRKMVWLLILLQLKKSWRQIGMKNGDFQVWNQSVPLWGEGGGWVRDQITFELDFNNIFEFLRWIFMKLGRMV